MNATDRATQRQLALADQLADLLARPATGWAVGDPNRPLLAEMIVSRQRGESALPATLGLPETGLETLIQQGFPGIPTTLPDSPWEDIPERDDLRQLLLQQRAHEFDSEVWMADIVSAACAGKDHLWQDLGLFSRERLTHLMWVNFPELARHNTGDMKWKKYLYKQFCSREGIYVCPAPSCGVCADYARCFGPET